LLLPRIDHCYRISLPAASFGFIHFFALAFSLHLVVRGKVDELVIGKFLPQLADRLA
jgi:hypothetical protein